MAQQLEEPVLVSQMVELRDPWPEVRAFERVSWPDFNSRGAEFELNGSKIDAKRGTRPGPSSSDPVATLDQSRGRY